MQRPFSLFLSAILSLSPPKLLFISSLPKSHKIEVLGLEGTLKGMESLMELKKTAKQTNKQYKHRMKEADTILRLVRSSLLVFQLRRATDHFVRSRRGEGGVPPIPIQVGFFIMSRGL